MRRLKTSEMQARRAKDLCFNYDENMGQVTSIMKAQFLALVTNEVTKAMIPQSKFIEKEDLGGTTLPDQTTPFLGHE